MRSPSGSWAIQRTACGLPKRRVTGPQIVSVTRNSSAGPSATSIRSSNTSNSRKPSGVR